MILFIRSEDVKTLTKLILLIVIIFWIIIPFSTPLLEELVEWLNDQAELELMMVTVVVVDPPSSTLLLAGPFSILTTFLAVLGAIISFGLFVGASVYCTPLGREWRGITAAAAAAAATAGQDHGDDNDEESIHETIADDDSAYGIPNDTNADDTADANANVNVNINISNTQLTKTSGTPPIGETGTQCLGNILRNRRGTKYAFVRKPREGGGVWIRYQRVSKWAD